MDKEPRLEVSVPLKEKIKSIPGIFGIRLEEQPKYQLVTKLGPVEIRKYERCLIAQTQVDREDHDEAVSEGFVRLANFIFGKNKQNEHMNMTTPLYQQSESSQIPMTAPVFQEKLINSWLVSFVLPSELKKKEVPIPVDKKVEIVEQPIRMIASLEYSGTNTDLRMRKAKHELIERLQNSEFKAKGQFQFAQYDPPFTIPFMKKNEIHAELEGYERASF